MALVGNTFYQASSVDPGTGFPMYFWHQTDTGLIKIRNAADTAWVLVGDSAQPYLGQLSTQGGNMNGAITGAHGLASAAGQDFSGTVRQQGALFALKTYVDDQIAAVNASIATALSSSLASIPALNIASKIAISRGTWLVTGATTKTIDKPYYSDGVQAAESECIWSAGLQNIDFGGYGSGNLHWNVTETANRVYSISFMKDAGAPNFTGIIDWFIIGVRKG